MATITPALVKRYDRGNVLGSVVQLPDQIHDAWSHISSFRAPMSYRSVRSIIVCGMGGSGFPAEIVGSVFASQLRVPYRVENGYNLPRWVGRDTLVLLSSYSGTTEETLSCAAQARRRGARCMVITTGGTLAQLAKRNRWPGYVFDPVYNVSNQPRMATGYIMTGILGLLRGAGLLSVANADIDAVRQAVRTLDRRYGVGVAQPRNPAKQLAMKLERRVPLIISAEHLRGTAHGFRNQINENAKHFAVLNDLPEMNHHLLEGLGHPRSSSIIHAVLYDSALYRKEIRTRVAITTTVLTKQHIPSTVYRPRAMTPLAQAYEALGFGAYVSVYLSALHRLDSGPIPWVTFFKAQLAKSAKL